MSLFGSDQALRLAGGLKRLRVASGLSGRQLAPLVGVEQSTVSRIERGLQRASVPQVALWCKATGADTSREAELLALAEDILAGPQSWEGIRPGTTDVQPDVQELEDRTGTLSIYQPAVLPGLLQTAAYARRLFSSGPEGLFPDLAQRVMNRTGRQAILYDEGKRFRFVIPEAVLRSPFGEPGDPAIPGEHREQVARVELVMSRPNVELGILPLGPSPVWRSSGFEIYDDIEDGEPLVHLQWLTRPYNIFEPGQVEMTRQAFANLMRHSATGDRARSLLAQVTEELPRG
jgi:transcriptional regulator with XRE-family HTH domain